MRAPLSVGVQWTLRYTLALLVTVSIFAVFTYSEIARRTTRDAELVLELQVDELAEALRAAEGDSDAILPYVERGIGTADDDLKLGFAVFGPDGTLRYARGSLGRIAVTPPVELGDEPGARSTEEIDVGENYPYLVMSVPAAGQVVQGALYMRPFIRNARDVRDIYLYAGPVLLLVTAMLGWALARGSLRPLQEMNRTARRITGTHLDERIPTTGSGDELDELAETLNEMIQRIAGSVERMRRFSGNAAHELRTPLNALRSRLEVTLEQPRDAEETRKALVDTAAEVEGLAAVVGSMMRLAQSEAGLAADQRVAVDLMALLGDVAEFFEPLAEDAEVRLVCELEGEDVVPGDPTWLHELFANLLDNAIKYTPSGGTVTVRTEDEPGHVLVHVEDTGIGIAEGDLPRIFQPFHRVGNRSEAPGVGLGLPIAREIARAHGGELLAESRLGEGTRLTVRLPREV